MVNIMKIAKNGVSSGVNLYAMDKITGVAGRLAVNFLPASIPAAAGIALGGLAVAVAIESLGKGALLKESAQFAAALAVSNALFNIDAIDDPISKIMDKVAAIGGTTAGYRKVTGGYQSAMAGMRGNSMRGYTTQHGF